MVRIQLLFSLCFGSILLDVIEAQLLTQPPENITAALGSNATFTCHGNGDVFWEINGTQVQTDNLSLRLVQQLVKEKVYVPLPTPNVSQLIVTATEMNNFTRAIQCLVDPGNVAKPPEGSIPVYLLVFAEPHPPSNLVLEVDGLNLVATWTEPFSLEGEEISYIVGVTNKNTGSTALNITLNETTYIFMKPFRAPNCEEYLFTVLSTNDFSKSITGADEMGHIPAEPLSLASSDVTISVFRFGRVNITVTISYKSAEPCSFYPVTSYTFNITERDTNTVTASIRNTSTLSLVVDGSNGLVPDQVYTLVIEAENTVGSTLSEELLIYTTGLQSVSAVMELNGSVTVTCSFATGASSAGCQVTILKLDSFNTLFLVNLTRHNGDSKVVRNIELNQDIKTSLSSQNEKLLVQTVELLSGGEVGSIEFNSTIIQTPITTIPPTFDSTTMPPLRESSQSTVAIGAVLGVVSTILLMIIIICLVVAYKKLTTKDLSKHARRDNTYELGVTGSFVGESSRDDNSSPLSMHNPVDTVESQLRNEGVAYPAYEDVSLQINHGMNTVSASNPIRTEHSNQQSERDSHNTMPYLASQFSPRTKEALNVNNGQYEIIELSSVSADQHTSTQSNSDTIMVPTDPVTGYSTLVRQENKKRSAKSQDLVYATVKVNGCRHAQKPVSGTTKRNINDSDSQPSRVPLPQATSGSSTEEVSVLPDDPETGYCVLKDDRPQQPPNAGPLYDTINLNTMDTPPLKCSESNEKSLETKDGSAYSSIKLAPLPNSSNDREHDFGGEASLQVNCSSTLPKDTQSQAVPTDPKTGYSTMIREDKFTPLSGPIPAYDSIQLEPNCDQDQKQTKASSNTAAATTAACPQMTSSDSVDSSMTSSITSTLEPKTSIKDSIYN